MAQSFSPLRHFFIKLMVITYAYFYVFNFECDPTVISQKLNLQPTKTWRKGDAWLPVKERKFNNWEIHSPLERSELFVDEHIKAVLEIIEPRKDEIMKFQNLGYETGINCVGYYDGEHPGFNLSAQLLARLAAFSLDVDFDLYCLCKDSGDE